MKTGGLGLFSPGEFRVSGLRFTSSRLFCCGLGRRRPRKQVAHVSKHVAQIREGEVAEDIVIPVFLVRLLRLLLPDG